MRLLIFFHLLQLAHAAVSSVLPRVAPARASPSVVPIKSNDRVGAMDPIQRADMKEFLQICDRVTQYLTLGECEELAGIMYVVWQKTVLPYGELDDLSASLALAKLSID